MLADVSNDMEIKLYYCNRQVWTSCVDNANGCRIYYGDGDLINHLHCLPDSLLSAVSTLIHRLYFSICSVSALTLLVGWQEEHIACKN